MQYLTEFPFLPLVHGIRDNWPQAEAVLSKHTGNVSSVAYSPDGRHIVSGSSDETVRVWDAETGEPIHELPCGSDVNGVAFSPDGRHIAALDDKTVRIWDSTTWEFAGSPLQGHDGGVLGIAYSPDGDRIVSADREGRICVCSTETFQTVYQPIAGYQDWI